MGEFAFELTDTDSQRANIKVIGVGGGGGNAINHMIRQGIQGVNFVCANTIHKICHPPQPKKRSSLALRLQKDWVQE